MAKTLTRFENGQLVRVVSGSLAGERGRVVRLRRCDDMAWVALSRRLPHLAAARCFPFPEEDSRATWVLLGPEECVAAAMGQYPERN